MTQFQDLPPEMKVKIFTYLAEFERDSLGRLVLKRRQAERRSSKERKVMVVEQDFRALCQVALVCREWRALVHMSRLWSSFVITLHSKSNIQQVLMNDGIAVLSRGRLAASRCVVLQRSSCALLPSLSLHPGRLKELVLLTGQSSSLLPLPPSILTNLLDGLQHLTLGERVFLTRKQVEQVLQVVARGGMVSLSLSLAWVQGEVEVKYLARAAAKLQGLALDWVCVDQARAVLATCGAGRLREVKLQGEVNLELRVPGRRGGGVVRPGVVYRCPMEHCQEAVVAPWQPHQQNQGNHLEFWHGVTEDVVASCLPGLFQYVEV